MRDISDLKLEVLHDPPRNLECQVPYNLSLKSLGLDFDGVGPDWQRDELISARFIGRRLTRDADRGTIGGYRNALNDRSTLVRHLPFHRGS